MVCNDECPRLQPALDQKWKTTNRRDALYYFHEPPAFPAATRILNYEHHSASCSSIHEYTNMPGDATILEGPVTPAPIFAYRAIRSIFFASPDNSPDYHNKENIEPISPTKPNAPVSKSPQLNPSQKRKRQGGSDAAAILSPTKGILRTPGLATPRAKYLRDVNVKFKSISPEARRSDNVIAARSPLKSKPQDVPQVVRTSKSSNDIPSSKPVRTPAQEGIGGTVNADAAGPLAPAFLEAYMIQTEKEIKRLVRYGQKMREFARQKDVANQELIMMIEELRAENGRLKSGKPSFAEHHDDLPKQQGRKGDESLRTAGTSAHAASLALKDKNPGYVRHEVDRVEATIGVETKPPDAQLMERSRPRRPPNVDTDAATAESDMKRATATQRAVSSPAILSTLHAPTTTLRSASTSTVTPAINTGNGTTRLPPDRAAAARERLRQRAEARKASAETVVKAPKEIPGAAKDEAKCGPEVARQSGKERGLEEPSELDWANL